MSISSVEKEILAVTKVKAKAKETRQSFLERVTSAVADLGDDDWNSLSDAAQNWCNDATGASNTGDPIPEFSQGEEEEKPAKASKSAKTSKSAKKVEEEEEEADEEADEEEADEEEADEEEEEEYEETEEDEDLEEEEEAEEEAPKAKKASKEKPAKEAKPAKEKAEKPAKAAKEKAPKAEKAEKEEGKVSGVTRIREITLQNPEMKPDAIEAIIRKEGFEVSQATVKANHADVHKTLKIMARLGIFDITSA